MVSLSFLKRFALAVACLLVAGSLGGCVKAQEKTPADQLLGTWFDNRSGDEYQFLSESLLVVPHAQTGGGNAVTYRLLDGDRLDIESAGGSHHVSTVKSVTGDSLTLADPLTGAEQAFYRDIGRTRFARSMETSALVAVSDFATTTPDPSIVWVAKQPTGKTADWTEWSTSTLSSYGTAWDWSSLKSAKTPVRTAGGGDKMGYSFTFVRKVPTKQQLATFLSDSSIEATAGLQKIDVGYSASKTQYPAGTLVYLRGGLIYSLGDGFAIAVGLDRHAKSFVPITHR